MSATSPTNLDTHQHVTKGLVGLAAKPSRVAKVGRNEPCPCGSGKKYKQCCGNGSRSILSSLPSLPKLPPYLQPGRIAEAWMGSDAAPPKPLRDARGKSLKLVLDQFTGATPEAVAQVRALGRVNEDGQVLFYEGDVWIGEADFSVAGEIQLITTGVDLADRLVALMAPISGLQHGHRHIDDLGALDHDGGGGGAELLSFKQTFFQTWLDEPNSRLRNISPRQAVDSPELRALLFGLIQELESKEKRLPKKERYCFKSLKAELGIL